MALDVAKRIDITSVVEIAVIPHDIGSQSKYSNDKFSNLFNVTIHGELVTPEFISENTNSTIWLANCNLKSRDCDSGISVLDTQETNEITDH